MSSSSASSERETAALAAALARELPRGAVVYVEGELGAGKTAFVRGLAHGLDIPPEEVSSPTFTLMQEYRGGRVPLVHVDLYRLDDAREVDDLGLEEIGLTSVLAIEWADKLPRAFSGAVDVRIEQGEGDRRTIVIARRDYSDR
jgi:tRNA threonylcarbamoyladenosine biosynthesis protein TsaE